MFWLPSAPFDRGRVCRWPRPICPPIRMHCRRSPWHVRANWQRRPPSCRQQSSPSSCVPWKSRSSNSQIAKLRRMQFGRSSERLARQIEQRELRLEELEAGKADDQQGCGPAAPDPGRRPAKANALAGPPAAPCDRARTGARRGLHLSCLRRRHGPAWRRRHRSPRLTTARRQFFTAKGPCRFQSPHSRGL